jgi:hypothetical protein
LNRHQQKRGTGTQASLVSDGVSQHRREKVDPRNVSEDCEQLTASHIAVA